MAGEHGHARRKSQRVYIAYDKSTFNFSTANLAGEGQAQRSAKNGKQREKDAARKDRLAQARKSKGTVPHEHRTLLEHRWEKARGERQNQPNRTQHRVEGRSECLLREQ